MSAMETMLTNMLKGLLPAEVLELMTPEKLNAFGAQVNAYLESQKQFQENTISALNAINERFDNVAGNNGKSSRNSGSGSGSD